MENQTPKLDPSTELPPPHDMELPPPHEMLLRKPHFTEKHSWIHWVPAFVGLIIGIFIGMFLVGGGDKNRNEINKYYIENQNVYISQMPTETPITPTATPTITPSIAPTWIPITPSYSSLTPYPPPEGN